LGGHHAGARGVGIEEGGSERFAGPGVDLDAKVQNKTVTLARGAEQSTVGVGQSPEVKRTWSSLSNSSIRMEFRQQYIAVVWDYKKAKQLDK